MSTPSTASKKQRLSYSDITPQQHSTIDALYGGNTLLIAAKGHGKTVVGQTAAQELIADGELKRVLIVAPLKVCQLSWATEHRAWYHLDAPGMAIGDEKARLWALNGDHPIVVINYENVPWLVKHGLHESFDGLLLDEVGKLKSVGSKGVRALRKVRKHFKWICGMSASPVAEAGRDIYSQALIIDGGKALGTRQDRFLRTYMYPTDYQERNWAFQPGGEERLAEALKDLVYVADDTDYEASLPELRDEIVNVEMPVEAWNAYNNMCEQMFITMTDAEIEAANQAVVSGKLLQITSGAVYDDKHAARWLHWAKFDALDKLIRAAEGPVAVAYTFLFQLEELRLRYPNIVVLGDDAVAAEAMWTAGGISLLAIHPKSASHGLNLQHGGHELIVLTPVWSADQNEQLLGRFRRRGQRSKYVRRTTLVVEGSIDELILDRQLNKGEAESTLMTHISAVAQK